MLNAGVRNDIIVPGYTVTKFPVNVYAHQMLPDGTTRNFGLSTQYVRYNKPMMTPLERNLAQDITNPDHISQWDPMLFTLGCPQMSRNTAMTDPFLTQLGIQQACQFGYQRAMTNRINSLVQNMARALGALASQLTNLINNDQLSDKQKERLEAKLEEVQELKERIDEAIQNQASLEELQALSGELTELQKSISEVIKEIIDEVRESKENDNSDDDTDGNGGVNHNGNSGNTGNNNTTVAEHDQKVKNMNDICRRIHSAISGPGTNYDDDGNGLKPVLEVGVDEDHIVELFEAWDKSYAKLSDNADDKGGFIETLMDDCEGDQKEEIAGRIIDQ